MIEIIPSLSVMNGKCVRLEQGNFDKKIVYDDNIIDIAKRFEDHGIKKVHLIDLEGAKARRLINYDALELVARHTSLEVNFGGGISTDGDLAKSFEYGAKSVTIGSIAFTNRALFTSWLITYGRNKVTLSADFENGKVRHKGWQESSDADLFEHIDYYYQRAVQYLKCSDTSKDGLMKGPAFDVYKKIIDRFENIKLVASGGVSSIEDIEKLADLGVHGVMIGRAFYEKKITLKDIEKLLS